MQASFFSDIILNEKDMIRFYNTLSGKKEVFHPIKKAKVKIFVCGPTVYDFSHLGHARTYIVFDSLVKFLRSSGYKVFYLQNITDIDDKIIVRAKKEKVSWRRISRKYEKEYLKDMEKLKINSITLYARATDHISEIISQVKRLIEKDFAYQIDDGIYFDTSKFKDYGKLSKRTNISPEDAVSRIDENPNKKQIADFCLWKFSKDGEPSWQSPFGRGRPGWHIEDTAITEKYFGPQYDIHGGAQDLIFPHHEAEIAQMESISGKKPMVRYWLHTGFLRVKGQKMSKSLGNFITIREFLKRYPPRILRYFFLKTHYRSPIDYQEELIREAQKELEKIDEFLERLHFFAVPKSYLNINSLIEKFQTKFKNALEDDFNTPKAISAIFEFVHQVNFYLMDGKIDKEASKVILKFLKKVDKIFNFIFEKPSFSKYVKLKEIPKKVKILLQKRELARKEKNWQLADELREEIKKIGFQIEDTKLGPKLKRIS